MGEEEKVPIIVIFIDGLTNNRITYEHLNFQLVLLTRDMGCHCGTKRSTSKNHDLEPAKRLMK